MRNERSGRVQRRLLLRVQNPARPLIPKLKLVRQVWACDVFTEVEQLGHHACKKDQGWVICAQQSVTATMSHCSFCSRSHAMSYATRQNHVEPEL